MAAKVLTQVVVVGVQIVGRAFMEAYREAAKHSAQNAGAIGAASSAKDLLTRRTGIALDEAQQILSVPKDASMDSIKERYEQLFKMNDPEKGGSFYLQSKIFRAKERIDMEFARAQEKSTQGEGKNELYP